MEFSSRKAVLYPNELRDQHRLMGIPYSFELYLDTAIRGLRQVAQNRRNPLLSFQLTPNRTCTTFVQFVPFCMSSGHYLDTNVVAYICT